jgi:choline-sulfatase
MGRKKPAERGPRPAAVVPPTARQGGPWRAVLLAVVLVGVGLAAFIALKAGRGAAVRREPGMNVLLITVDTLRADAVGAYGHPNAGTPWMDRLAAEGVLFTRAHAHNVVTFPSHANILSGRYPLRHGVRDNAGFRFPAGMETIATLLKSRGYSTGAFVSAFPLESRFGLTRGFDVYDDRLGESGGPAMRLEHIPRRPGVETVEAARRWIAAQVPGQPYFCWVHLYEPHWPYAPPEPFASRFRENPYQGGVATADAALGPLVEPILEQGAAGRTLVVLTADHGEALGDHDEITHGILAYEATLRIPLVLYGPRLFSPRVVRDPVRHVDLLPTILDAVGLGGPVETDGRSLLALAAGRRQPVDAAYFEALTAAATRGWAPLYGVIRGSQKYVDLPIPELYDLDADPREQMNLAPSHPGEVAQLRSLLLDLRRADPGFQAMEESGEARERLKALGYAAGGAPQKARYTEEDDPKRLMGVNTALSKVIGRYDAGDLRGALALCREVVASRPTMPQALHYLAHLEWQLGQREAAVEAAQRALSLNTDNTEVASRLGYYLAQSGRSAEAATLLEPYARRRDPDVDVVTALAVAYASSGRAKDAIAAFDRLLAIDPTNAMALLNKGRICVQSGRSAEAREAFEAALRLDPALGLAHVSLGLLALQAGRTEEALEEWRKALETDPHAYEAMFNLGATLLRLGRVAEARPFIERYMGEAPPTEAANAAQLGALLARAEGRGASSPR